MLDTSDGEDVVLPGPVAGPALVDLWTESLGRVNYGPRVAEPKGITGGVRHERQYLHGVRARGLRLDAFEPAAVGKVVFGEVPEDPRPGLYRGSVEVAGAGDAWLRLPGSTRGFVWVNGFCLGRYWAAGPQDALFVPGPVLREGANEVWVLEVEGSGPRAVELD